jgi:diaminohydroxyphosphoribosylaminopyrimidine deaminase/5-amino-6-(5-phosphoribosylamino)uracil reductase
MKRKYELLVYQTRDEFRGCTFPNPMVASILVRDNQVLESGVHTKAGQNHAERDLLLKVQKRQLEIKDTDTLYVNLEPCCHYGRTPPCTEAILQAGVKRVVVGMTDPNPLVAGKGIERLELAGVEVIEGVEQARSRWVNRVFIKNIVKKRPYITLKMAATLDGLIADQFGTSKWITGEAARADVHRNRSFCDGLLVGNQTVLSDNPSLNTRLEKQTSNRVIVLDRDGLVQGGEKLFASNGSKNIFLVRPKQLPDSNQQIVCQLNESKHFELDELFGRLWDLNFHHIYCEGGASVASSLLDQQMVDELHLYFAPKVLGGAGEHTQLFSALKIDKLSSARNLEIVEHQSLGKDLFIAAIFPQ